ncbi:hypothetical protein [Streptomyces sp. NBC_00083]|uniref:hypothetical protein n=1 Tax=Streptomyces sp. NBC_00083 TaxID=2975647 RepID=UPI002257C765|nr:hypothetical protein [Streptomyces sp. NBC_00083]MCX5386506.1 hypothetical protein [Streptomyces sp. NBC_00083]
MENSAGPTQPAAAPVVLPLRRPLIWVPLAAIAVAVLWWLAVAAVFDGPNGDVAGPVMAVAGVAMTGVAAVFAGYLLRPLRIDVDDDTLTVRLPTWLAGRIDWDEVTAVSAVALRTGTKVRRLLVVDLRSPALPYISRPRSMYRRLAPVLGRPVGAHGLCFEEQIFAFDAVGALEEARRFAPAEVAVDDRTAQPVPSPWQF